MKKEILDLMEVRRKTKHDEVEYKKLTKERKKKCDEEKEKCINEQCKEIEQNQDKDSKFMHSKINEVTGHKRYCSSHGCLKAQDGTMLMENEEVLARWSEYVEELFRDDRRPKPVIKRNLDAPSILKEEVKAVIKNMMNGKATGPDNILVEMKVVLDDLGIPGEPEKSSHF